MDEDDASLRARLDEEELILAAAFPGAQLDRHNTVVLLPDYRLPAGWSHERTDVLFVYPSNYPRGCPDNVCTRSDLKLASGDPAQNLMGEMEILGRTWLQFSWHIEGEWRPTATPSQGSNLVTYLLGALHRFDEAS